MNSKYLKYAFGEIILVVIGILIALSINNWNEKRKSIQTSNETLNRLYLELTGAQEELINANRFNQRNYDTTKAYLEGKLDAIDKEDMPSKIPYFIGYAPIKFSLPILERELEADHLIVGNDQLIDSLRNLKSSLNILEQNTFYLDTYWNGTVVKYLTDQNANLAFLSQIGIIGHETSELEIIFESIEFKNIVSMVFLHLKDLLVQSKAIESKIEGIIDYIEMNSN